MEIINSKITNINGIIIYIGKNLLILIIIVNIKLNIIEISTIRIKDKRNRPSVSLNTKKGFFNQIRKLTKKVNEKLKL